MDHIQASCIFHGEVCKLNRLEQSKICVLTVTLLGIAMLTIHHEMIISVYFIQDPRDVLRQTSANLLSEEECTIFISQRWDFSGRSLWFIPVKTHTTSDRLGEYRRNVGNPCDQQQCATGFILCRMRKLAVTHAILTWSYLYIPQVFPLLYVIFFFRTSHFIKLSSSLHFHSSKSWLYKHLGKVRLEQNPAELRALHPICHPLWPNGIADTT